MQTEFAANGVEPIAVIGMAARLPGAGDVATFWRNLVDGVESITFYSREEQLALGATEAQLADPSWVSAAPVIDDMECFDAGLFGMTAREAELANPQHRVFLEAAHTALDDAGYDSTRYDGAIGVYAGTGADHYQWLNLARNPKVWQSAAGFLGVSSGNYPDYVATTVSYRLNLRGPSFTVHTACSTSLVAVHLAVEALRNAECDMALAGGACIELPHGLGYQGMEGYTSPDGHCRPFDARANGTLWGSGVGVVLLKRLSDAIADGDHVRAVVLGNAINNDGSDKVGFSAPSVSGQTEAIAAALAAAAIDPRTVGYVEAHGTGTALGDPIEVAALTAAYTAGTAERQWCGLGSVKSNLGHLSQAAGVVGFIKAVLALEHGMIPPTINFDRLNPAIDLADSPFYIATTLSKWEADGNPRRAAISSFGIGGTNAHVILAEAPAPQITPRPARPAHLLPLSARTAAALSAAVQRLATHLQENRAVDLADVAYTLRAGRTDHPHRAVVVAASVDDAVAALRGKPHRDAAGGPRPRVALLFSGQGAQYAGMGAQLYELEPVFAAEVDRCAALLEPELGLDVRALMFGSGAGSQAEADAQLRQTRHTQPALFVLEYALATLWRQWGVEPAAMIGHSIGEYVAAALAGVFELPDALRLVATRGRLMQSMPAGSMLAVQLDEAEVAPRLPASVSVATVNGPGACVVSGPAEQVRAFAGALAADGVGSRELRTSHAFHSPMMEPILAPFADAVAAVPRRAPRLPFLSNLTGDWITAEQATDPGYWAAHLRQPVRFGACLATLLAGGPGGKPPALVECGPGRQLAGLARRQLRREDLPPQPSLPGPGEKAGDLATLYTAAGRLWAAGVALDAEAFAVPGRRTALPAYPYQRTRHWIDPDPDQPISAQAGPAAHAGPLPLDEWFAVPTWHQLPPLAAAAAPPSHCLVFADRPAGAAVADALRAAGTNVTAVRSGATFGRTGDAFTLRPAERADYDALIADLGRPPERIVHAWALDGDPAGSDVDATWRAQSRGFFSVLHLAKALAAVTPDAVHLDVLSAGTEDVLGGDLTRPEHATLAGIAKVLPLELPWLRVRRIDLDVSGHQGSRALLAELCQPAGDAAGTVALRRGRRWAGGHQQVTLAGGQGTAFRPQGRYLITGGLGGIGITVAEDLARRLRARLVLVSRSGLPPRDEWDAHLAVHGEAGRTGRAVAAVRRMARAGASVLVVAADVTDPAALREVREQAERAFGGLDGIVHAAGLPGGGMAEVKEHAAAATVLAPKLAGTLALQQAFGDLPLDFVVLCSSVTGIAGGLGQVDYCAANAFLDAFARCSADPDGGWPGTRVLSLNWGAWLEVGMAVEAGAAEPGLLAGLDHPLLRTRDERACWGAISADGQWLLDEHRIAGVPVVPGTGHLECLRAAVATLTPRPNGGDLGHGAPAAVELTDVAFLEPLSVPQGAVTEYRVELAGEELTVASVAAGRRSVHVRGSGRWVDPGPAPTLDLAAVKARCRPDSDPAATAFGQGSGGGRTSMVTFGPRWGALAQRFVGDGEELAIVEAPAPALADLDRWPLHPALLDVATSFGSRGDGSYLPLSYGRVLVREPLPARFYSHLRYHAADTADGIVSADLTLAGEDGRELVSIGDFVLRRVDAAAVVDNLDTPAPPATAQPHTGPTDGRKGGAADERGIRPSDGVEALHRVLAADLGPQVVINTETVDQLLARAARTSTEALQAGAELPATPVPPAAGSGADHMAPRTELEATVAAVWRQVLRVDEVGIDDDFFDLGGNSLVAVELIARIRQAAGVRLPMRSLFETPTVAGLAERVAALSATNATNATEAAAGGTPQTTIPRLPRPQG